MVLIQPRMVQFLYFVDYTLSWQNVAPVLPPPKPPTIPKPPTTRPPPTEAPDGENGEPVTPDVPAPPQAPRPPTPPKPPTTPGQPNCARSPQGCSPAQSPTDPVPSIEELQKKITTKPSSSLFFSGPSGSIQGRVWLDWAKFWAKSKSNGYETLDEMFKSTFDYSKYDKDPAVRDTFWDRQSEAMAKNTQGVAYVALPKQAAGQTVHTWFKGTTWDRVEWGALQKNVNVEKVYRVDPITGEEELILDRATGFGTV